MKRTFSLIFLLCVNFLYSDQPVFVGITVKNYDQLVPYFLRSIENINYDKKDLSLQINNTSDSPQVQQKLKDWVAEHKNEYKDVTYVNNAQLFNTSQTQTDRNRLYAVFNDNYIAKSKEKQCERCLILSSEVFILPGTLNYLLSKNEPVVYPMLRPMPEEGDPFRNFFLDVTEHGYYKHHEDYFPVSNRTKVGTFKVPSASHIYFVRKDAYDKVSFSDQFRDWEFLSFSKSARDHNVDQYLTNEKEFGFFLHFNKDMKVEEEKNFQLAGTEFEINPTVLHSILADHYPENIYLHNFAKGFDYNEYAIYRVRNSDLFYVDDINDYIKNYVVKQGKVWEEHFLEQFKKYAKPGSTALDIGGHIGTHTLQLSKMVGENGKVHVFEPQTKIFCELAVNMHLNNCKNVVLHHNALGNEEKWIETYIPQEDWTANFGGVLNEGHGTVTESATNSNAAKAKMVRLDDLNLDNISFIKLDVEGFEMDVIQGGKETILRNKPVMIVEIFNNDQRQEKIRKIESLGYIHTHFNLDDFLFYPVEMLNQDSSKDVQTSLPAIPSNKNMNIAWEGTFLDFGSLSNVNRSITRQLAKKSNIQLSLVSPLQISHQNALQKELVKFIPRLTQEVPQESQVVVRHAWPPDWKKPEHGKWILFQHWEFGSVPEDWVENCKKVDEIWVSTRYEKEEFVHSDIPAEKVKIIPLGYNPKKFNTSIEPYKLATNKKFKFLYVGGTIYRKGADNLLESYLKSFTAQDDVTLIVKDFGTKHVYAGQTQTSIFQEAKKNPNAPEIVYMDDDMSAEQVASIYRACDCLVCPYRGEGFALPVIEAMACGIPVIVTAGGSTDDFVSSSGGWLIPSHKKSIGDHVGNLKLKKEGWVLQPDNQYLAALMRWVVQHPEEVKKKGKGAQESVKDWTWTRTAGLIESRLQALSAAS